MSGADKESPDGETVTPGVDDNKFPEGEGANVGPVCEPEEALVAEGPKGADGADDEEGAEGADGEEGIEGTVGADGEEGIEGTVGADGEEGIEGTVGADGEEGAFGAEGADGASGAEGGLLWDDVLPDGAELSAKT